jgi:hypothetical protein
LGAASREGWILPQPLRQKKEATVATPLIPVKTPEGQAELSQRLRRVSQRHRTVLLLVDGRRTEQQVRSLALQAGAVDSCFAELVALGMIEMSQSPTPPPPAPFDPSIATVPITPLPEVDEEPLQVDIPLDDIAPSALGDAPQALLPAARSMLPESTPSAWAPGEPVPEDSTALESGGPLRARAELQPAG